MTTPMPVPGWPPAPPHPSGPSGGQHGVKVLMLVLPVLFMGLFAWVPPLWAAAKNKDRPAVRRRLQLIAGGCAGLGVVGFTFFGLAPQGPDGVATGPLPWFGFLFLLAAPATGTIVAVRQRHAGVEAAQRQAFLRSPEVQQALAGRRARGQYRQLALQDPVLAHEMRIGRADLPRNLWDGGLVDLNALPVDELVLHAGLRPDQAEEVVAVRGRLGRLASVDDLVVHGRLDALTAERLREYAVFL